MLSRHFGKIYRSIVKRIDEEGCLFFLVIDPPNQKPADAASVAAIAEQEGAAAVAVGGSVGAQGNILNDTIVEIKRESKLPVILFPGNIATISEKADAIYFMSMLNSLDPYYISGAQIAASMPVKRMKLEVIPTAYIIVEPGRAVGWVGRAHLIPRDKPYLAAASALAGEFMGMHIAILESGGGAAMPAPPNMVAEVAKTISIPLVVAGGVCKEKYAYETARAGASIIHVGSAIEKTNGSRKRAREKIRKMIAAMRKGVRARK
ncbi:MAG: geranylgeranylglyceryl/heptaprenylglyceryl phosphate synthase [Candidatus Diapherotrites archaeon]|nr:geranylgeranylglyceryl/heptaprenylglyceryl phosphate synthase [Candidatus Diapherotrites archaeon]